jgi:hypothetical protein
MPGDCWTAHAGSTAASTNLSSGCWRSGGYAAISASCWISPANAPTSWPRTWWSRSAATGNGSASGQPPARPHLAPGHAVTGQRVAAVRYGYRAVVPVHWPDVGEFAGDLFGNGVFLVVAWVGLWYPIDVLFIAREQAKREARVLHLMLAMPVVVRARGTDSPIAAAPGSPNSPPRRSRAARGSRIRLRGAPATGTPGAH